MKRATNKRGEYYSSYAYNYGWLLLFFIGVLIVLFYFGLLKYGLYGGKHCNLPQGFLCKDPYADPSKISFSIKNHKLVPIQITSISLLDGTCDRVQKFDIPVRMENRAEQQFTFTCDEFAPVTHGRVVIEFENVHNGLTYKEEGKIRFLT